MNIIYIKVTAHDLAPAIAVAIYSSPLTYATPGAQLQALTRKAARQGLHCTYELTDRAAYDAHYARMRIEVRAHLDARNAK